MKNKKYVVVKYKCKTVPGYEKSVYLFNNNMNLDLEVGSHVLVDTVKGFQYGIVSQFTDTADFKVTKDVVCVIDVEKYLEEKDRKEMIKRVEAELLVQIETIKRRKELEKYAGQDPVIDDLLSKLRELEG